MRGVGRRSAHRMVRHGQSGEAAPVPGGILIARSAWLPPGQSWVADLPATRRADRGADEGCVMQVNPTQGPASRCRREAGSARRPALERPPVTDPEAKLLPRAGYCYFGATHPSGEYIDKNCVAEQTG